MLDIKRKFLKNRQLLWTPENEDCVPLKFRDGTREFCRFYRPLKHAVDQGYSHGLDFGCGTADTLILGQIMGLQITGFDKNVSNNFQTLQKHMNHKGYNIKHYARGKVPVPHFSDNEFDFIIGSLIFTRKTLGKGKNKMWGVIDEWVRISANESTWYLSPHSLYKICKQRYADCGKNIQFVDLQKLKIRSNEQQINDYPERDAEQ